MALHELTLSELSAELTAGRASSREIVDALLQRIDKAGAKLHAFTEVYAREARALADAADTARGSGFPLGPLHGYGIARRIEQTSGDLLAVNYGTLYPALLKLEQEGYIRSEWGLSDNNRKAKYYRLTRAGKKQLEREARDWEQTTSILARFLAPGEEPS